MVNNNLPLQTSSSPFQKPITTVSEYDQLMKCKTDEHQNYALGKGILARDEQNSSESTRPNSIQAVRIILLNACLETRG